MINESKRPVILIANDDGIDASGIRLLAEALQPYGELWVVAPAAQCSGMSQRISILQNLTVEKREFPGCDHAYSVTGTPADCVKIALEYLMPRKPDYVFSGINLGFNAGYDCAYSGTMGAALEGVMNGVPSYAVSGDLSGAEEVERVWLPQILEEVLQYPHEPGTVVNINFPPCKADEVKGILRNVPLAPIQMYADTYTLVQQEGSKLTLYQAGERINAEDAPEGTDINGILRGYITIGPVHSAVM